MEVGLDGFVPGFVLAFFPGRSGTFTRPNSENGDDNDDTAGKCVLADGVRTVCLHTERCSVRTENVSDRVEYRVPAAETVSVGNKHEPYTPRKDEL